MIETDSSLVSLIIPPLQPRTFLALASTRSKAAAHLVQENLGQSMLNNAERFTEFHFFARSHRDEYFDTFCNMPNELRVWASTRPQTQ